MNKTVKLNDQRTMVVWSDNVNEQTMDGYSFSLKNTFDIESDTLETWNYKDICCASQAAETYAKSLATNQ